MSENDPKPPSPLNQFSWSPLRWPLYVRVLIGVVTGTAIGYHFGKNDIFLGWNASHLSQIASLYVRLLTALATPLIFLAIVEAFVRTQISGRQGLKLILVCAINICAAFAIGLVILNVWQPGNAWKEKFAQKDAADLVAANSGDPKLAQMSEQAAKASLSPLDIFQSNIPKSIGQVFTDNMVLPVAALAILVGAAMRALKGGVDPEIQSTMSTLDALVVASYQVTLKILMWLIELAPFAICLAVAGVVGSEGLDMFKKVAVFFVTIMAALGIHALVYYPLTAWLIGGVDPVRFFRAGAGAILTGFSLNSSLATAPLTLEVLRQLGVSDSSARLSACVGTNFNNDGITLYEAITALFIAQAAGMDLSLGSQITILLAALAGSMGIAGIPNSGLIILTLVLKAAKFSDDTIQLALPIVYSIDFILARVRSAVNVMGDIQVATLLDAGRQEGREDSTSIPAKEAVAHGE
jgi:Na+/H+-dicarboxylate symporter